MKHNLTEAVRSLPMGDVLLSTRWQCCLMFNLKKPSEKRLFIIIQNIYDALASLRQSYVDFV